MSIEAIPIHLTSLAGTAKTTTSKMKKDEKALKLIWKRKNKLRYLIFLMA